MKKTVKQIVRYLKLYYQPKTRELGKMAYNSALEYYKGTKPSREEFTTYQRAYVAAYRQTYAKLEMNRAPH